jgi:hypothetical protein
MQRDLVVELLLLGSRSAREGEQVLRDPGGQGVALHRPVAQDMGGIATERLRRDQGRGAPLDAQLRQAHRAALLPQR